MVCRGNSVALPMKHAYVEGATVEQELALMDDCGDRAAVRASGIHEVGPLAVLRRDKIPHLDGAGLR